MKLFTQIISLEMQHERRERITRAFSHNNLFDVHIVTAVYGKSLDSTVLNALARPAAWESWQTPNVIGCMLSHRKCYENLLATSQEFSLILEDDAILTDNFEAKIDEILVKFSKFHSKRPVVILLSNGRASCLRRPYVTTSAVSIHKTYDAIGAYGY